MENKTITCIVDNRTFLIGLDYLFRKNQKRFETETLLPIVEGVNNDLNLEIKNFPVEGYYNETEELKRYFTIIRNLQGVEIDKEVEIRDINGFNRLLSYVGSKIFGEGIREKLLPRCIDSLGKAIGETYPNWNILNITETANKIFLGTRDYSLVGLACYIKDEVAITALRESVVLYSGVILGASMMIKKSYKWSVDKELQDRANKFIQEFNLLTGLNLPLALPENARVYYEACDDNNILYRCVNIGKDETGLRFYHWAIEKGHDNNFYVKDFWDDHLWTTEEYRQKFKDSPMG